MRSEKACGAAARTAERHRARAAAPAPATGPAAARPSAHRVLVCVRGVLLPEVGHHVDVRSHVLRAARIERLGVALRLPRVRAAQVPDDLPDFDRRSPLRAEVDLPLEGRDIEVDGAVDRLADRQAVAARQRVGRARL
eukprot:1492151-Prymnesium_polylepis.1